MISHLILFLSVLNSSPPASKPASYTILKKVVGGLSSPSESPKKCELSSTQFKEKLKDVEALVQKVEKIPPTTAYHMMATVPSIEYWASLPTGKSFEIFVDYSEIHERKGKESEELIRLINLNCEK